MIFFAKIGLLLIWLILLTLQLLALQINAEKYFFGIRKSLVEFDEVLEVPTTVTVSASRVLDQLYIYISTMIKSKRLQLFSRYLVAHCYSFFSIPSRLLD